MKRKIITINREFGSGGREVGKRLADILEIPYYDNEIVTQIARRTQLAEKYVRQISERGPHIVFPITVGRSFYPTLDQGMIQTNSVYVEQGKILKELAEKSDCVIIGRCANHVLERYGPMRIFVCAEMDYKIRRCREKAPEHEHMTDKQLRQHIAGVDKNRASYYKFVAGGDWADRTNYDLCVNTTHFPIKQAVQAIAQLSDAFGFGWADEGQE